VVLPLAGYPEVGAGRAIGFEAVLVEHPLGCDVVQQGRGFETMQAKVVSGDLNTCARGVAAIL
jgi:hypothetical protein